MINGIVHGIPHHSNYVVIYNLSSNKVSGSEQILSSIDGVDSRWYGGVIVNSVVYNITFVWVTSSSTIRPPTKCRARRRSPSSIDKGGWLWISKVTVNGILYGIPFSPDRVG